MCKFCNIEKEAFSEHLAEFVNKDGGVYLHRSDEDMWELISYNTNDNCSAVITYCPCCGRKL